MMKLSYWARDHRNLARLLLIACFIILYITGIFAGGLFRSLGLHFNDYYLFAILAIYPVFYFYYPSLKDKLRLGKPGYYVRVRRARLGLTLCLLALVLFAGNRPDHIDPYIPFVMQAKAIVPAKDSPAVKYWSPSEFRAMMKDANGKKLKLKERKKLLRKQVTMIQQSESSDGTKALLIALSIIVALGAVYLVLILSCALACNDMGVLAVVVLLGGVTLVVFGLIKVIQNITRKKPKDN